MRAGSDTVRAAARASGMLGPWSSHDLCVAGGARHDGAPVPPAGRRRHRGHRPPTCGPGAGAVPTVPAATATAPERVTADRMDPQTTADDAAGDGTVLAGDALSEPDGPRTSSRRRPRRWRMPPSRRPPSSTTRWPDTAAPGRRMRSPAHRARRRPPVRATRRSTDGRPATGHAGVTGRRARISRSGRCGRWSPPGRPRCPPTAAMRAREVAVPTAADLLAAEATWWWCAATTSRRRRLAAGRRRDRTERRPSGAGQTGNTPVSRRPQPAGQQ